MNLCGGGTAPLLQGLDSNQRGTFPRIPILCAHGAPRPAVTAWLRVRPLPHDLRCDEAVKRLRVDTGVLPSRHVDLASRGGSSRSVGNHENLIGSGYRDGPWVMAEGSPDVAASIAELQALLLGTESIDGFLREMAVLAAGTLGEGLSCGITLQPNGRPLTVASSDQLASQVDELQYGLDQGPCLAALRTGEVTRIDDLAADKRWRPYAVRALAYGVRSSLSYPMRAQDTLIGALNVYSGELAFFGEEQARQAEQFAQNASVAVGIAARMAHQAVLTDQLRASLASRSVIDQALGVIMGEERCTAQAAFELLRAVSQNRNIKLRQVAEDVVTRVTGKAPQPPPFDPPPRLTGTWPGAA